MNKLIIIIAILSLSCLSNTKSDAPSNSKGIAADSSKGIAVVELFTSEGCSSCPPADEVINSIAVDAAKNNKPIYVLEEHVDYWDNLGWKDPYSSSQFTQRQEQYQKALNKKDIYTPQILVNGTQEIFAAERSMADQVIQQELKIPCKINISLTIDKKDIANEIHYHLSAIDKNWGINFALIYDPAASHVTSGENSGKTLTHKNIVSQFVSKPISAADGRADIETKGEDKTNQYKLIVFVQDKTSMKIVGATEAPMPN